MSKKIPDSKVQSDRPLTIRDFAEHHRISSEDVWDLIEDGALMARRLGSEIFILENPQQINHLKLPEETEPPMLPLPGGSDIKDKLPDVNDWLHFGKTAIEQISRLNQDIVRTKDQLLEEKQFQLDTLSQEVKQQEKTILSLRQQIEDLETLAKTLSSRPSSATFHKG